MKPLQQRTQWIIGIALALILSLTRSHHFATPAHLPDASWAVFFLAGLYLGSWGWFTTFTLIAVLVDWIAITFAGVSDFCVTPAYAALLLAYALLWGAGRGYRRLHHERLSSLFALAIAVTLGAIGAELCSSGSFYLLSGRFAHPSLGEFLSRESQYFPGMLESMSFYIALAAIVHVVFAALHARHDAGSHFKEAS